MKYKRTKAKATFVKLRWKESSLPKKTKKGFFTKTIYVNHYQGSIMDLIQLVSEIYDLYLLNTQLD